MPEENEAMTVAAIEALKLEGQTAKPKEAKRIEELAATITKRMVQDFGRFMGDETKLLAGEFPQRLLWTGNEQLKTIYNKFDEQEVEKSKGLDRPLIFNEMGARYYSLTVLDRMGTLVASYKEDREIKDFYQKLIDKYGDDVHRLYFGTLADKETETAILQEISEETTRGLFYDSYSDFYGTNDKVEKYKPSVHGTTFIDLGMMVMKPAVSVWNEQVADGFVKPPEDKKERRALRKRYIDAMNNANIAHELTHMFYLCGHPESILPPKAEEQK